MKIFVTKFPIDLVTHSLLFSFCLFLQTTIKNQVYIKLEFFSSSWNKGIFLHVIPVRIIVPWLNQISKSRGFGMKMV